MLLGKTTIETQQQLKPHHVPDTGCNTSHRVIESIPQPMGCIVLSSLKQMFREKLRNRKYLLYGKDVEEKFCL